MKEIRTNDGRIFTIHDDNRVTQFGVGDIGKIDVFGNIITSKGIYRVIGGDILDGRNEKVGSIAHGQVIVNDQKKSDDSTGYVSSDGGIDIESAVEFTKKRVIKPINIITIFFFIFLAIILILNSIGIDIFDLVNNHILPKFRSFYSGEEDIISIIGLAAEVLIPLGVIISIFIKPKKK